MRKLAFEVLPKGLETVRLGVTAVPGIQGILLVGKVLLDEAPQGDGPVVQVEIVALKLREARKLGAKVYPRIGVVVVEEKPHVLIKLILRRRTVLRFVVIEVEFFDPPPVARLHSEPSL